MSEPTVLQMGAKQPFETPVGDPEEIGIGGSFCKLKRKMIIGAREMAPQIRILAVAVEGWHTQAGRQTDR